MKQSTYGTSWKWKIALAGLLAFTLILSACGGGKPAAEKKKVVIYTSMYEDIIEKMDKVLEDKFPDIDVEFFYGGTGTLQAKIAAEISAGKLGCDMLMVAEPSYALELMDSEVLHPYKIANTDNIAYDFDKDGYWYPVRVLNMVLAYNPDKNAKADIPNSFKDFAFDTKQAGYISMPNLLTSGSALAATEGLLDKYTEDWFKAVAANRVAVESGSVALTKLESGEANVIMILEESVLKKRQEEGSKLEVIYPTDGVISVPSPIMTINEKWSANGNLDACEKLTDWFLSAEGQEQIVAGWMHPVLKDFTKVPYDAIPTADIRANAIPVNWEKTYKQREEIRSMFQEYVTVPK